MPRSAGWRMPKDRLPEGSVSIKAVRSDSTVFQLALRIRFSNGTERVAHCLADTGADVSLVNIGYAPEDVLEYSRQPLSLETATGGDMAGGSRETTLVTLWNRECTPGGRRSFQRDGSVVPNPISHRFYEADIGYDMYLGRDFVVQHKIAPFGHNREWFQDQEGAYGWILPQTKKAVSSVNHTLTPYVYDPWRDYSEDPVYRDAPQDECRCPTTFDDMQDLHTGVVCRVGQAFRQVSQCKCRPPSAVVAEVTIPQRGPKKELGSTFRLGDKWEARIRDHWERPVVSIFQPTAPHHKFWARDADVMDQDWGSPGLVWINAPWELMTEVVAKIQRDGARAVVVCPAWPQRKWFRDLMQITQDCLEIPRCGIQVEDGTPSWDAVACLVDGRLSLENAASAGPVVSVRRVVSQPWVNPDLMDREVPGPENPKWDRHLWEPPPSHTNTDDPAGWEIHKRYRTMDGKIRSVVETEPDNLWPGAEKMRERLTTKYADTLSGKTLKDPPVRGPFGEAKLFLREEGRPRRQRGFRAFGEKERALIDHCTKNRDERGWLEPSTSEWSSPPFPVPKPTPGEWRMVVDFRWLNECTKADEYPLPLIEDLLEKQSKYRIFTVLDMKHGFHQMPLRKEDRHLTSMPTPLGTLQWTVMPMGIKTGPPQFQRMMDWVLRDIDCASVYIDDVIIGSNGDTEEELLANHERDVERVLQRFKEQQLVCGSAKSSHIAVRSVQFCGHILENGTKRPAPGKLVPIQKWERPDTITKLRSFLGVCNYYSGYVPQYAEMAAPLMEMLKVGKAAGKKGSSVRIPWTVEADKSFEDMKVALGKTVTLHSVNPDAPFFIRTDASKYAIGAVLEQVGSDGVHYPLSFWSRKLTPGQRNWTPREQETYAILCALKKWSAWIGLQEVNVLTDHESLESWETEHVDTPSGPAGRRGRWHETFSKFNLHVRYIPGKDNVVADAMSRWAYPASEGYKDCNPHGSVEDKCEVVRYIAEERRLERSVCHICTRTTRASRRASVLAAKVHKEKQVTGASNIFWEDWTDYYLACSQASESYKRTKAGETTGCRLDPDGRLVRGSRVVVPEVIAQQVIQYWHEQVAGHAGIRGMVQDLEHRYEIPRLSKLVTALCQGCPVCQACNHLTDKKRGFMQPYPVPGRVMSSIAIDIKEFQTKATQDSTQFDSAIVIADRHSGFTLAVPCTKAGLTGEKMGRLLMEKWMSGFDIPTEIMCDRGPQFVSGFFKTLCAGLGIRLSHSKAYRHQGNGRAENAIKTLMGTLRKLELEEGKNWLQALPQAVRRHNQIPGSLGMSPYQILYGRDPQGAGPTLPIKGEAICATEWLAQMARVDKYVAAWHAEEGEKQAKAYNQKRKEATPFAPGCRVWVKRRAEVGQDKLLTPWMGPCEVVKARGAGLYVVKVSPTQTKEFHPDEMKAFVAPLVGQPVPLFWTSKVQPKGVPAEDEALFNVAKIVDHRTDTRTGRLQFRTHWEGYRDKDDTWEFPETFLPLYNPALATYLRRRPSLRVDLGKHLPDASV